MITFFIFNSARGKYYCNTNALPVYGKSPVPTPLVPQLSVPSFPDSSETVTLLPPLTLADSESLVSVTLFPPMVSAGSKSLLGFTLLPPPRGK